MGQSYDPNYVTHMLADSCLNSYAKANWLGVNSVNEREVEPSHIAEVQKPKANCGRVKKSGRAVASQPKTKLMNNCSDKCACETASPWQGLHEEQHNISNEDFPTAEEASSIPSETTRT